MTFDRRYNNGFDLGPQSQNLNLKSNDDEVALNKLCLMSVCGEYQDFLLHSPSTSIISCFVTRHLKLSHLPHYPQLRIVMSGKFHMLRG